MPTFRLHQLENKNGHRTFLTVLMMEDHRNSIQNPYIDYKMPDRRLDEIQGLVQRQCGSKLDPFLFK